MAEPQVLPDHLAQRLREQPHIAPVIDQQFGEGTAQSVLGVQEERPAGPTASQEVPEAPGPRRDRTVAGWVWNNSVGAVAWGVQEGINELADTVEKPVQYLAQKAGEYGIPLQFQTRNADGELDIRLLSYDEAVDRGMEGAFLGRIDEEDDAVEFDIVARPEQLAGKVVGGFSQFGTGYFTAGRIIKVGGVLGSFIKGGVADAAFFDPDDKNIAAMLDDFGIEMGPFKELLATDPDDPEWANRMRNVAEGAIAGGLTEALFYAARARKLKAAGKAEEAADAMASAIRYAEEVENGFVKQGIEDINQEIEAGLKEAKAMFDDLDKIDFKKVADQADEIEIKPVEGSGKSRATPDDDELVFLSPKEAEEIRLEAAGHRGSTAEKLMVGTSRSTRKSFQRAGQVQKYVAAVRDVIQDTWTKASGASGDLAATPGKQSVTNEMIEEQAFIAAKELADLMGEDVNKLWQRFKSMGEIPFDKLPAEIVARSKVVAGIAEELDDLALAVQTGKVPERYKDMTELMADFDAKTSVMKALVKQEDAAWSTVGRTLQARRIAAKSTKHLRDVFEDPQFAGSLKRRAEAWTEARKTQGGKGAITKMDQAAEIGSAFLRRVNTARINFLLSGPGTQTVNAVSSMVQAIAIPGQQIIGGLLQATGNLARLRGTTALTNLRTVQHGIRTMQGMMVSARESVASAAEAWRMEEAILDPHMRKIENADLDSAAVLDNEYMPDGVRSWLSTVDKTVRLPSRMLLTMDEFFKQASYRGTVMADAAQIASDKGLKGDDKAKFIKGYLGKSFDPDTGMAIREDALRQARRTTFTEPLEVGSFGHDIQNLAVKWPFARMIVPFVRTPINLFSTAWQHMPAVGTLSKRFQDDVRAGGARRAQAIGKQAIGLAIVGWGMHIAATNRITGSGPSDPRIRNLWLSENKPYSIKFEDEDGNTRWYSYARYEPMSQILAITADAHEIISSKYRNYNEEGMEKLIGALVLAVAENTVNKTFTQGIYDFFTVLTDGGEGAGGRALKNFAVSFIIPNFFNQTNGDEVYREMLTLKDMIWARGPNYEYVDPKRNIIGEKVLRPSPKFDPMNVMYKDVREDDKVMEKLTELAIRNSTAMSEPSPYVGNADVPTERIDLREVEYEDGEYGQSVYDAWMERTGTIELNGKTLREDLSDLIETDYFKTRPPGSEADSTGTQLALIRDRISMYREAAKKDIPQLMRIKNEGKLSIRERNRRQYQEQRMLLEGSNRDIERNELTFDDILYGD